MKPTDNGIDPRELEAMGLAAMLPGLMRAHVELGLSIDAKRARLQELQTEIALPATIQGLLVKNKRGRPAKAAVLANTIHGGWSTDPEVRKVQQAERMAVQKLSPEEKLARRLQLKRDRYERIQRQKPGGRAGWSTDPEERKADMKRRIAVSRAKGGRMAAGKPTAAEQAALESLHPRDSRSPRHEAWVKALRKARRKQWNALTAEQRKEQLARMNKARHGGEASAA